jgi:hypothetical protein
MQGIGSKKARLPLQTNGGGGTPTSLELTPPTAQNEIGERHCVTATVRDANNNPVPGVTVRFRVTGPGATSGSKVTTANGTAEFCYSSSLPGDDLIDAYADLDQDNVQDAGEPSDTATKTWVLPPSSELCEVKVTNGGWIIAANGDRASFGGNAKSDAAGNVSGNENYQDHGPAQPMHVKSIVVTTLLCNEARTRATILGKATIDGSGSHDFRIDVADFGEPGSNDRYRMRINAYDSGEQVLQAGNVQIH